MPWIFLNGDSFQLKVGSETTLGFVAIFASCPIRLQDSLIINFSGKVQLIS